MRRPPRLWFGRNGDKIVVSRIVARLVADDRGVTAIEYTLITMLIVMALVALITEIGDFSSTPFVALASYL